MTRYITPENKSSYSRNITDGWVVAWVTAWWLSYGLHVWVTHACLSYTCMSELHMHVWVTHACLSYGLHAWVTACMSELRPACLSYGLHVWVTACMSELRLHAWVTACMPEYYMYSIYSAHRLHKLVIFFNSTVSISDSINMISNSAFWLLYVKCDICVSNVSTSTT